MRSRLRVLTTLLLLGSGALILLTAASNNRPAVCAALQKELRRCRLGPCENIEKIEKLRAECLKAGGKANEW